MRRKIKSPNLKIENMFLGTVTDTNICLTYIEGIVEQKLVDEVKDRLGSIKIDGILESSYVEELINDSPRSVFPTVNHTERPDKLAAMLLEGKGWNNCRWISVCSYCSQLVYGVFSSTR